MDIICSTGDNYGDVNFEDVFPDYTQAFTMPLHFITRERMCEWVRSKAKENGFVIVIGRSDTGSRNTAPRTTFTCERSGTYREKTISQSSEDTVQNEVGIIDDKKTKKKRESGSKKCGCPFKLKARQVNIEGEWFLEVVCGVHNHSINVSTVGHSFAGRLEKEEEKYVLEMSQVNARPKNILHGLKTNFLDNKSVVRTIYNARLKNRVNESAGRSNVQQLMYKLEEHQYFHLFRRCNRTNTITDLFFAHPVSIELLRAFPYVILMDCTYKTNRYKLPLLEIVGVTSTQMTFLIACAYLESEKEDNYTWACGVLKSLMDESCLPNVIVTDRELALMNAVQTTFPTSRHFLCRWHINRNIAANCKKILNTKEIWDEFNLCWNLLVGAETEERFNDWVRQLNVQFSGYPTAVKYVMDQWIVPYKDRFVTCWTNQVMHFDNLTTNRAEGQHAALKKQLGTSQGSFETCWLQMHKLIETSHVAITHSFEKSRIIVLHKFKSSMFSELRGMVSMHALTLMLNAMNCLGENGVDVLLCRCHLRLTCGLPCPHELTEYLRSGLPIPLSDVHAYWRKLDFLPVTSYGDVVEQELRNRYEECKSNLGVRFEKAQQIEKTLIVRRLTEFCNPEATMVNEPEVKISNKGRPKGAKAKYEKSTKRDPSYFGYVEPLKDSCSVIEPFAYIDVDAYQSSPNFTSKPKLQPVRQKTRLAMSSTFIDQFPLYMHNYIEKTVDVIGDGHCGFRAVGELLGRDWSDIRSILWQELYAYEDLYRRVFIEHARVEKVAESLQCFHTPAPKAHWFDAPFMGYLVASAFNVVLVSLSKDLSLTFLPLQKPLYENPNVICIGFVNGNHYIKVILKENCPLPPVALKWHSDHQPCAAGWLDYFSQRIVGH